MYGHTHIYICTYTATNLQLETILENVFKNNCTLRNQTSQHLKTQLSYLSLTLRNYSNFNIIFSLTLRNKSSYFSFRNKFKNEKNDTYFLGTKSIICFIIFLNQFPGKVSCFSHFCFINILEKYHFFKNHFLIQFPRKVPMFKLPIDVHVCVDVCMTVCMDIWIEKSQINRVFE